VPFGQTQGGLDWVYNVGQNQGTRVYGASGTVLPRQAVTLQGDHVNLVSGSHIDLSGGGDLQAYEFIPGTGGTRDVLDPTASPGLFAIIPALHVNYAPYDAHEYVGTTLKPGDQVELSGGGGLAAGRYTLLPARYALLPGAFLVRAVGGYQDIAAGDQVSTLIGGTVVAGRSTIAGTDILSSRTRGFEIRPGSAARVDANYTLSTANTFFPARALATGVAQQQSLPRDAGGLGIRAGTELTLDATLNASVATLGRGASLELSSDRLRITNGASGVADGSVEIDAAKIAAFGAQTTLLGGQFRQDTDGMHIDVRSSRVDVAAGASLQGPEVLLAARDSLSVLDGARVMGVGALSGATLDSVVLDASSSLLRVSSGGQIAVTRGTTAGGAGLVSLASGAVIGSTGSATVNVGVSAVADNRFEVAGNLALSAPRVALGDAPDAYAGLVYRPGAVPGSVPGALTLNGRTSLDLFSGADFNATDLTLVTPRITAGSAGLDAHLSGTRLRLVGVDTSFVASPTPSIDGRLTLAGDSIDLSGNSVVSGFHDLALSATGTLSATGAGSLTTGGTLSMASNWLSARAGVDYSFGAVTDTTLSTNGDGSAQPVGELGGRLALVASSITGAARFSVPSGQLELVATGPGGISLANGSVLDVAGRIRSFDGDTVGSPGGTVSLRADVGSIDVAAGGRLSVAGAGTAAAGGVRLAAAGGDVRFQAIAQGSAAGADQGGSLQVIAHDLDFASLLAPFAAGQFTGALDVHQTGTGTLAVGAGQILRAASVTLTNDGGGIDIAGTLDATSARGGQVELHASGPLAVEGSILARATDAGVGGGRVLLDSATGVTLAASSRIDVGGNATPATGGVVDVRATRGALDTLLDASASNDRVRLDGSISGAREVNLEGYATYDVASGHIADVDVLADLSNPWYSDAADFAGRTSAYLTALGHATDARYRVLPGLELRSSGNLTLDADWNLADWRFNGAAGVLSVRAGGTLYVDHSISDGFFSPFDFLLSDLGSRSWSYRLAAGADLLSANPLGIRADATGDLRLAAGAPFAPFLGGAPTMIRTGTGRIDIATAGDMVLGNQAAVIYTAGRPGAGITLDDDKSVGGLGGLAYPESGGDIRIRAGRDVLGAKSDQLFTDWLWRAGSNSEIFPSATAWTISYDRFEQGVATLGGGRLDVSAGRDIVDLGASTPSIGRQVGGASASQSIVQVTGGGDLNVTAGRDVRGGTYYAGLGRALLGAGDRIMASGAGAGLPGIAPVLALGDSQFTATAVRGLDVAAIVNPTLLDVSLNVDRSQLSYFSTYSNDSAVSLTTSAGKLGLMTDLLTLKRRFPTYPTTTLSDLPLKLLPPHVRAAALSGTLRLGSSISLWPAPRGNLELLAAKNLALETVVPTDPLDILISDASTADLPTISHPAETLEAATLLLASATPATARFNAPAPVHGGGVDSAPVHLVAVSGDVTMQTALAGRVGAFYSPKPLRLFAGRDVVNFAGEVQNLAEGDVTSVEAGRDVTYLTTRDANGSLSPNRGGLVVDGPGRLDVSAGRSLDLQASSGLVTQGNLRNTALMEKGADISVVAGTAAQQPAYDAFIERYLAGATAYDDALKGYLLRTLDASGLTKATALARFRQLDAAHQRPLLEAILVAEIRAGGRAAAQSGNGDYSRAFTALQTLFPGSNPDTARGETNPYSGDIRLFFSRLYTLDGGDISLFAPGGEINVGLATPPKDFGINKKASELGLVAQSTGSLTAVSFKDFQVNESRAFAADGGDILVWSTAGDIDAGRGAKTAISAPPPVITIDSQGKAVISFPAALSGSGIQTLATTPGRFPGNVDLFAPRGVVNAGDAGIVAGNLTIGATAVLGANNISVSGTSVGVPVETGGLGASLSGAASSSAAASSASQQAFEDTGQKKPESQVAQSTLAWLEVFVEGFGDEVCRASDEECLRRSRGSTP
jgi:hypothetical protein